MVYICSSMICGEGNGTPLQYSWLENPMDGGAWWAAVHGVTKSQTRMSHFTSCAVSCHLQMDNFILFQFGPFYFFFFPSVLGLLLARTSKTMLKQDGGSGHFFLFPDLGRNASHHWVWCWLCFCHIWFLLCWYKFLSWPFSWEIFFLS